MPAGSHRGLGQGGGDTGRAGRLITSLYLQQTLGFSPVKAGRVLFARLGPHASYPDLRAGAVRESAAVGELTTVDELAAELMVADEAARVAAGSRGGPSFPGPPRGMIRRARGLART